MQSGNATFDVTQIVLVYSNAEMNLGVTSLTQVDMTKINPIIQPQAVRVKSLCGDFMQANALFDFEAPNGVRIGWTEVFQ